VRVVLADAFGEDIWATLKGAVELSGCRVLPAVWGSVGFARAALADAFGEDI
jgi:hypothetical protein